MAREIQGCVSPIALSLAIIQRILMTVWTGMGLLALVKD
jgi:hypothetical protein